MATTLETSTDMHNLFVAGWRMGSEFVGASRWRCRLTAIDGTPHAYHVVVTERNEKGEYHPTEYWIDIHFGTVLPPKLVVRLGRDAFTAFSQAWFEKRMGDWNIGGTET